jgi:hypothetical protein
MALVYRNVVGPIKDAQGNVMESGAVKAKLNAPVTDGTSFVYTEAVTAVVTNGAFTLSLGAPGTYTFTVTDAFGAVFDTFTAYLTVDSGDVSLAALYASV